MLKKLRVKFIAVTLSVTALVLLTIIGFINIHNYNDIVANADLTLHMLQSNGGRFPTRQPQDKQLPEGETKPPEAESEMSMKPDICQDDLRCMSPEAPFETRFFSVTMDDSGNITKTDIDKIAAVDDEKAGEYALAIYDNGNECGFCDNYRYIKGTSSDGNGLYIFLDCTKSLNQFHEFLRASILISVSGLAVVSLLVIIFSGVVMKPFAELHQKQKQFITDANHELKTPLTVINASCEILEYNTGENEWTDAIKEQVGHLTELTNKLVLLSSMDEDNKKYIITDFSLSEVAEEAVRPFYSVAKADGKSLECNIEPNLSCHGDMGMIKELFSLLLDKAIKYSDAEGNIKLSVTANGKTGKIVVSNTTDGVPKGNLDVLFERFYRLDKSRNSNTGGHGVGLSVAKSIVTLHKGKITAFSPDGRNIVFTATVQR